MGVYLLLLLFFSYLQPVFYLYLHFFALPYSHRQSSSLATAPRLSPKGGQLMNSTQQNPAPVPSPCIPPTPETWITAAQAASILHLSVQTVLSRAQKGHLQARIPDDLPLTQDGKPNFLIRLESLPPSAQLAWQKQSIPMDQRFSLDLASSLSRFGDTGLRQSLDTMELIRQVREVQASLRNTGTITAALRSLAQSRGISLASLYRLCQAPRSQPLSLLYTDPVYLCRHLPKTMCLWTADFAYARALDPHSHFSQNQIFRELSQLEGHSCTGCPYRSPTPGSSIPRCEKQTGGPDDHPLLPNNRRTLNRLLARIPPQMLCFAREGARQWQAEYGHFAIREKPLFVNELWQGDHHIFDLFVRVRITRRANDRLFEQEIAVRPVLTAWMDTATGCLVGWVISILPNADTIAEAFCRAVIPTVGEEFRGLPHSIYTDCGKDYKSSLLEDLPPSWKDRESQMDGFLNRRFSGLGLLPALSVTVHHAKPWHPQSKSIERLFGTLERIWICQLPGWCHHSPAERPARFAQHLQLLLKEKKLLTMEEFVRHFQSVILPGYHHLRESSAGLPDPWVPSLEAMSPIERYHALEKPWMVTPDWDTLSALKRHRRSGCRISQQGIRFRNCSYWHGSLSLHTGETADLFYLEVEPPYAPSSVTVTVQGRFLCEAFPVQPLRFSGESPQAIQAHLDEQHRQEQTVRHAVARIRQSASGILPPDMDPVLSEPAQLRDECYSAAVSAPESTTDIPGTTESGKPDCPAPAPASPSAPDHSRTAAADIAKSLALLFGE